MWCQCLEIRLTKCFVSEPLHPYFNTVQRLGQYQLQKIFRDANKVQCFQSEFKYYGSLTLRSQSIVAQTLFRHSDRVREEWDEETTSLRRPPSVARTVPCSSSTQEEWVGLLDMIDSTYIVFKMLWIKRISYRNTIHLNLPKRLTIHIKILQKHLIFSLKYFVVFCQII